VSDRGTREVLDELARPLRLRATLGGAAMAVGALLLVFAAAAWLVRLGAVHSLWWVPSTWLVGVASAVAALLLLVRLRRLIRPAALARMVESAGGWRLGAVSGLLTEPATGVSADLYRAADRARAADLAERGRGELTPLRTEVVRRNRLAGAALLAGVLGLLGAGPARGPVRMLWHPADAVRLALGAVRIEASSLEVNRGDAVELVVRAPGRQDATLWMRAPGETWSSQAVTLDSLGEARVTTDPLVVDLFVRASSGGRGSDTLRVAVRIPAFLGTVSLTARYPRYLGLEDEPIPFGPDTIVLPEGTRLSIEGEATAALASAVWRGPSDSTPLAIDGGAFRGDAAPPTSGTYQLVLATASGAALGGEEPLLHLRIAPDSAPEVTVPVPGADTIAPVGLRVPLVVAARDDHGLTAVAIVSRRISRLGIADPERRDALEVPAEAGDRVVTPFLLSLEGRSLLPGDTVRYYATATDNAPRPRTGRSREYVLRLPTLAEVRAAERQATEEVGARLDSLAAVSKRLQRQTEDLSRETSRPENQAAGGRQPSTMSFEDAKRAEAIARQQEELVQQAEETRAAIEELRQAAEAAGITDPEFQQRMEEIADQLEQALTREMRQQLEALREALSQLDGARARQALQDLAEAQQQLKEALERSQKLFERAAVEGQMANMAEEARDLAAEQERWNTEVDRADPSTAAALEEQLAARADSLAAAMRRAAEALTRMDQESRSERLETTAATTDSAARMMQQAANAAKQGRPQAARQQGERAEQQLGSLGDELDAQREQMQGEWKAEVVAAIDRMMAETSRLAEQQLQIAEALGSGEANARLRNEQAAVEEGVEKLAEQYRQAAGENALVPPQIGATLEAARRRMGQTRDALSTAASSQREAAARAGEAVDALNAAAYQMARARGDVSGAGSGSGLAEAMQRMGELARQQGQLSQQGSQMLPMLGSSGMQEQLRQLSAQQRALAEQLERLRAETQSQGTGELAAEARDLARQLEAGRLDRRTVERQERLFRRMLDAGRTLQGQEQDDQKERQSVTGDQDELRLPPALRLELEGADRQLPFPSWEQLQRLSPEDRRLVLDYFRRLAEAPAR